MLRRYVTAMRLLWAALFRPRTAPWYDSPAHRLVGKIAGYCHTRYRSVRLRALYFRLAAVLKYRELVYIRKLAFVKRLIAGQSAEETRAQLAVWQLQTRRDHPELPPPLPVHGIFALDRAVQRPFDVLAPVLSSRHFSNLSFIWGERQPRLDPALFLPVQDRTPGQGPGVSYGPGSRPAEEVVREIEQQGFGLLTGAVQAEAYRKVNDLLKAAAPRHLVVAAALKEDELGFCDAALGAWLGFFHRIHARFPWTLFCVLNPTTVAARSAHALADAGVLPVRCRGLDELAAFAFPIKADVFFGEHGALGMAAVTAAKPGIYFHPKSGDHHDCGKRQWFLADPTPENAEPILTQLIACCTPPEIKGSARIPRDATPLAAKPRRGGRRAAAPRRLERNAV